MNHNTKFELDFNHTEKLIELAFNENHSLKMTFNHSYVIAPQKILRCYRLTASEKMLLLDIMSSMGRGLYAEVTFESLALRLELESIQEVIDTLNSLHEKGFIMWVGTFDYDTVVPSRGLPFSSIGCCPKPFHTNPYIIMSEFVHYYTDFIWGIYGDQIQYSQLRKAIMGIVSSPELGKVEKKDIYGDTLAYLAQNPDVRDDLRLYFQFGNYLQFYIEQETDICIDPDWIGHVIDWFKENVTLGYHKVEDGDDIEEIIPDPYDSLPFVVAFEGIDEEGMEIFYEENDKIARRVLSMSESELRKEIERQALKAPHCFFHTKADYDAYLAKKDANQECWPLLANMICGAPEGFLIQSLASELKERLKNR
ncbi:hypothetical protein [Ectobacillus ponti]|uniref:Uncharacterized protein n=1 Tax=Ectobacillus ponti TaxID=2961894 RepID=A0AA42BRJ5_9BACI|nr:hypothetical protein [Ectobacillus ponti]MCP8970466.1 hypothetical protein [Ectobacillus ponti]